MFTHTKQDISHRKATHIFVFIKYLLEACCVGCYSKENVNLRNQEAQVQEEKKGGGGVLNIGRTKVELMSICNYLSCATYLQPWTKCFPLRFMCHMPIV